MSDLTTLAATAADVPGLVIEISSGQRTRIVDGQVIRTNEDRVTCFVGKESLEFSNIADALLAIKLHQMLVDPMLDGRVIPARQADPVVPAEALTPIDAPTGPAPRRSLRKKGATDDQPLSPPPAKKGLPGPPRPTLPARQISLEDADRELAAEAATPAPIVAVTAAPSSSFADRQNRQGAPRQTADPNRVRIATTPTVI